MRARVAVGHYERLQRTVLNPLVQTGTGYYVLVLILLIIVALGVYA